MRCRTPPRWTLTDIDLAGSREVRRQAERAKRLMRGPGIGLVIPSALAAIWQRDSAALKAAISLPLARPHATTHFRGWKSQPAAILRQPGRVSSAWSGTWLGA